MKKSYGQIIPNLTIDGVPAPYPVVNERAIRATAGIMFVLGLSTFYIMFLTGNIIFLKFLVPAFWLDFFLKTVWGPEYSIFGFLGRLFVRGQRPEYVGAIQKRFAWGIGLTLASIMMILVFGFGILGWAPRIICLTCLTFMWMESSLGICAGCKIYGFLLRKKILKEPQYRPACPGGACALPRK